MNLLLYFLLSQPDTTRPACQPSPAQLSPSAQPDPTQPHPASPTHAQPKPKQRQNAPITLSSLVIRVFVIIWITLISVNTFVMKRQTRENQVSTNSDTQLKYQLNYKSPTSSAYNSETSENHVLTIYLLHMFINLLSIPMSSSPFCSGRRSFLQVGATKGFEKELARTCKEIIKLILTTQEKRERVKTVSIAFRTHIIQTCE